MLKPSPIEPVPEGTARLRISVHADHAPERDRCVQEPAFPESLLGIEETPARGGATFHRDPEKSLDS